MPRMSGTHNPIKQNVDKGKEQIGNQERLKFFHDKGTKGALQRKGISRQHEE